MLLVGAFHNTLSRGGSYSLGGCLLVMLTLIVSSCCLNNTGFEERNGFLIGNGSVLLFSAMDDKYLHNKEYQVYSKRKRAYADLHGYGYVQENDRLLGMSQSKWSKIHPTMLSVFAAKSLIQGSWVRNGEEEIYEWIMYLDADAFPAEMSTPASFFVELANDYYRKKNKNAMDYPFFIAQDSGHVLNSGWWMIRNCSDGFRFVDEWIKNARHALNGGLFESWMHDQGALQETVLQTVGKINGHNYTNSKSCYRIENPHAKNVCYQTRLQSWGFQAGKGVAKTCRGAGIVLLPHLVGIPYEAHTHSIYKVGQYIWHHKDKNEGMGFEDYHYFSFNWETFKQDFINGTLVKQAGMHYHQIFLLTVENGVALKHSVPDLDTVRSLQHELQSKEYMRQHHQGPKGGIMEVHAAYMEHLVSGKAVARRDWTRE